MKLTQAFAFETITVSTTAIGLTGATYDPVATPTLQAWSATLSVEGADIRARWDGTDPTASVGHWIEAGQTFTVVGDSDLRRLRMIRKDSTDATVRVTYER